MVNRPEDLKQVPEYQLERIGKLTLTAADDAAWDQKMNLMMTDYI